MYNERIMINRKLELQEFEKEKERLMPRLSIWDLTTKLQGLVIEVNSVMKERKKRVSILQEEIDKLEKENEDLETTITKLLGNFNK